MNDYDGNIYHENLPNIKTAIAIKSRKIFRAETVTNFLPFVKWLPTYRPRFLLQDFVAGFTVGLTAIPQSIAYGAVAGLPPQYGLYSAIMGCFVYIFFGSCKDITVGPTAIMALMVQVHVSSSPAFAALACFLSGCVITVLGLLNLGVLVQFISMPVTTGFTMAAAITIGSGQINNLFGMSSTSNEFVQSWKNFFTHISKSARLNDTLLGVFTLVLLLILKKFKDIPCRYRTAMKYIALSRNALAVVIGTLLAYLLSRDGSNPFRLSGEITPGLPPFRLPPFSTIVNGTKLSFADMVSDLGPSIATIPLIAILESIAIAKAFSKGKIVDASQEMIALGLCNIMGSFVLSMPVTGSFTRTAINNSSGVKTPLGGAFTGAIVIMALAFLTKTFYFIPKATLAAIIIAAMTAMVEYEKITDIWKSKRIDISPLLVTLITCLFWGLEYGMISGIAINTIFILYNNARPQIEIFKEKIDGIEVGIVQVHDNLSYSSAEYINAKIVKFVALQNNQLSLLIIDGKDINSIDSTVGMNILSMQEDLNILKCEMICLNWNFATAGVVCRLSQNARKMFHFNRTIQEIVMLHLQQKSSVNGEIHIP